MRIRVGTLTLSMLGVSLAGCAMLVHGTTQQVHIETTPPGAKASVGSQTITTPGELTLSREYPCIVNFEKAGFAPAYVHIEPTTSNLVWGNILLGGYPGAAIDYASGAAYDLGPATVYATLAPNPDAEHPAASNPPDPTP